MRLRLLCSLFIPLPGTPYSRAHSYCRLAFILATVSSATYAVPPTVRVPVLLCYYLRAPRLLFIRLTTLLPAPIPHSLRLRACPAHTAHRHYTLSQRRCWLALFGTAVCPFSGQHYTGAIPVYAFYTITVSARRVPRFASVQAPPTICAAGHTVAPSRGVRCVQL